MLKQWLGGLGLLASGLLIGFVGAKWMSAEKTVAPEQVVDFDTLNSQTANRESSFSSNNTEAQNRQILEQKVAQVPLNIRQAIEAVVDRPTQFEQYAASYPLASKANQTELGQMIDILISMESNPDSIGIARIFYVRFVNLDPQAAFAHFWRTVPESSSQYRRVMYASYHEWAWFDMAAALDDIVNNTPQNVREGLITFLLGDDHFGTNPLLLEVAQNYSERTRAAALLASADHESNITAFERILAMPKTSDARRHGLYRLVRRWAKDNPQEALERLKQMTGSGDQQNLMSTVISVWAETDPEVALQAAIAISGGRNFGYSALSSLAKKDGARAMELAQQYAGRLDSSIQNQVLQTWASSDARSAAAYIELKGPDSIKSQARQIAWHYTMQYPDEAYEWAQRMGLADDANVASNMGNALVQTDLNKAEALFAQLPPSASRSGLFTNIVSQRSKVDLAEAHKWLSQYKDEAKYGEAQKSLMYEWSRRDPTAAIEVALEVEDETYRVRYLSLAANSWYDRDSQAAVSWVYDLPQSNSRDRIMASLSQKVSHSNQEEALYIANQIVDEQLRQNAIENLKRNR